MEIIAFILLIILVLFSIKDLKKYSKLPNTSYQNIYENSKHFRLLIAVIISIIGIVIFIISKIT